MSKLIVPVTEKDHIRGNIDAPITLLEYGDYECPYCGLAHPIVQDVLEGFNGQLRFAFRHFPLTQVHPYAEAAAETTEFAGSHNRFWEMHDLLFQNQRHFSMALFIELAEALGLSRQELERTLINQTYENKIRNDFLSGVRSGVNGTPTFFINKERYNGSLDFEELTSAIKVEVENR